MKREKIILTYFQCWIDKDITILERTFSKDIVYTESYGPEYHGINQCLTWFSDWNQRGSVLKWDVKQFLHCRDTTVVEWYFECDLDGVISGFDGVSIINFDDEDKIYRLKEFQSKSQHHLPYGNS